MARCARPGCDRHAEVALGYDTAQRVAWLATELGEGALAVCGVHAERMAVPNGWRLDDRRRSAKGRVRVRSSAPVVAPGAGDEAVPAGEAAEDSGASQWEPRFDQNDDLGGLLAARTPLLARAFSGGPGPSPRRKRRRSAPPDHE